MPLQHLKRIVIENKGDGTQVTRLPNNQEMMDKINEIVSYINGIENKIQYKSIKSMGIRKVR